MKFSLNPALKGDSKFRQVDPSPPFPVLSNQAEVNISKSESRRWFESPHACLNSWFYIFRSQSQYFHSFDSNGLKLGWRWKERKEIKWLKKTIIFIRNLVDRQEDSNAGHDARDHEFVGAKMMRNQNYSNPLSSVVVSDSITNSWLAVGSVPANSQPLLLRFEAKPET